MPRHYASHAKRVRVNVALNASAPQSEQPSLELQPERPVEDPYLVGMTVNPSIVVTRPPSPEQIFHCLTSSENLQYGQPWSQRDKGDYASETRDVTFTDNGIEVNGRISWNSEYGLTVYCDSARPDLLIRRVCDDLRQLHLAHGFESDPNPVGMAIHREEICTWIPEESLEQVKAGLPCLIRYAETVDWMITVEKDGNVLIIHNLIMSMPTLYPEGGSSYAGRVMFDVKLYKTDSRNQPFKLEFQARLPKLKTYPSHLPVEQWNGTIRATCLKLMDAFLEFCGVKQTVLLSGQERMTEPLDPVPYERAIYYQLRALSRRSAIVRPATFIKDLRQDIGLKPGDSDYNLSVGLLRSFRRIECDWADLAARFTGQFEELGGDSSHFTYLKPTRSNLYYMAGERRVNTTSGDHRAIITRWVGRTSLLQVRQYAKKPGLLRLTDLAFLGGLDG